MERFEQEYLCQWVEEFPAELLEIAEIYHARTEEFDRHVCSGPFKNGSILPANAIEYGKINKHAYNLKLALEEEAARKGFSKERFRDAIRAIRKRIERVGHDKYFEKKN